MSEPVPDETFRVPLSGGHYIGGDTQITIYGATFEHVAGPTRPIEGVVSR